ncbi:MAG: cobalamin-dependent protein [Desulfobacterales bacterium]|jgi:methanogenic corrinoid protein MtbC1
MTTQKIPDFERVLKTLNCKEPDRVPLGDFHIDPLIKNAFMGKKVETPQDQVAFFQTAGFDYVTEVAGFYAGFGDTEGITTNEETAQTSLGEGRTRQWAHEHEGVITSWEAFEKYAWPTADDFDFSIWETYDNILPSGMKAMPLLGKIYTPVWMLMGAEVFFNTLETDEELAAAVFEKVGKIQFDTFQRLIEHPCVGAVANPDDIAHNTGLLVNPKFLRKYLFPWYKKMGDICRDRGLGFIYHSDGDCSEVLQDLIDCGFHGYHPIQPNCMDIVEVKKKWGKSLCLLGNINLDSTLTLGTPEDVRAEVYERIRTIGPGGGYMVSSSNSIPDYVPVENMKALFDATFEFGAYPIELEEGKIKGKIWTFTGKPKIDAAPKTVDLNIEEFMAAMLGKNVERLIELTQAEIDAGRQAGEVVDAGMIPAMTTVGKKFQSGEIYIPEMLVAAKTMSAALDHFKDQLIGKATENKGTVVIGTVKGDLHDIGKNLVTMMLQGQGFTVEDLGISVDTAKFLESIRTTNPDVLAMSALLTTTMVEMKNTIDALEEAGLRKSVKIIVGGAPLTQAFADQIGADGYAYDAPGAAQKCSDLISDLQ